MDWRRAIRRAPGESSIAGVSCADSTRSVWSRRVLGALGRPLRSPAGTAAETARAAAGPAPLGNRASADETAAEKIIDALPWDGQTTGAATAILKSLLQLAKGKRFVMPDAPTSTRQPEWQKLPEGPSMPGETIIKGPVWRF